MTQIAELFESYETLSLQYNFEGKTMRLFGVELNQSSEKQSRSSSPERRASRDINKSPWEHQPSSPEQSASLDLIRQQGERRSSSPEQRANEDITILPPKKRLRTMGFQGDRHGENNTSREGQRPIDDFTRHLAQTSYYHHQTQGEASRQQDTASSAFRPWQAVRSPEAQRPPEQSLLDEASCSQQQSQGDLHPHARIDNIQRALQFGIDELERLRSSAPPHTERMAPPQPEEMLLSNDEVATVSPSDSQGEPNHNSSHKRKRDEASSSRALDSTIYGGDLAPQQQVPSDQAGHKQRNKSSAAQSSKRDHNTEYQNYKAKLAAQGTTPWERQKARAATRGTNLSKIQYGRRKARAAEQGTTPWERQKARAAQGTNLSKIQYERRKARAAEQGLTVLELRKIKKAMKDTTSTTER